MLLNYLKIALRNLLRRRVSALINIFGLAIGLSSFILIMLYVVDELSYDRYHRNHDRIYRLVSISDFEGVGEVSASAPFPVAPALKNEYPGLINEVVRVFNFQTPRSLVELGDIAYNERRLYFADSAYFDMFDYNFLMGDPHTALNEPFATVITAETARKYFRNDNPMGKTLRFEGQFDLKVTGVIEKVPSNSHFHFDILASLSSARAMFGGRFPQTWVWNPCWTYIELKQGVKQEDLEANLAGFTNKFYYDAMKENITLYLQALTDIHLHSRVDYEIEPNGNITYVHILSAIAIFLLVIAIINFMNLSTATSTSRAKEIGMKKVVGASRPQLIKQFLGEAILLSFIALLLSLLMVELTLPFFNNLADKSLSLTVFYQPIWFSGIFLLGLLTGVLSGIYPAFYISSFQPLKVLKGQFSGGARGGQARKILVTIQFAISVALIVSTLIAFDQLHFLKNAELGFNKESVVIVPISRTPIVQKYEDFRTALLANPNILSVTAMDDIFGVAHNTHEFRPEGFPEDKWQFYPALVVQFDFLKTFEIPLVAGRDYNRENKTDAMNAMLINESMVKHLGWKSNEDAIGKKFRSLSGDERVVGVFKDFNATSLHSPASPFVLNIKENDRASGFFMRYVAVRLAPGSYSESISFIEDQWHAFTPQRPFEFSFLKDELNKQYREEVRLSSFSLALTLLIILVAGMGLFGLTAYMVAQRSHEMGIRLTFGASFIDLLRLFSREYVLLVFMANLISWPVAWLLLDRWLNNFAYHTQLSLFYFVVAGIIALALTIMVIWWQTLTAVRANPIRSLRSE